jgi:hypothetical protein
VVKAFAANEDVAFGDVNLSEANIRGGHQPGAGGWPTIRYFNAETGVAGASYEKKTSKAMCEELGSNEMMTAYVEEYGIVSTCSVEDGKGCDDKEIAYIEKFKEETQDNVELQLNRLDNMAGAKMTPQLLLWMKKRKKILRQLLAVGGDGSNEL